MVGRVPPNLRAGMRTLAIGMGTRDAARVISSFVQLGVLLPGANLALLEQATAKMFERFGGLDMATLRQIDMRQMREFALEFRGLLYSLPFQLPEDMIYLGRTVAILSGMCTGLNPQFNMWTTVAPFAQQLVADETTKGLGDWLGEAGNWARTVVGLPNQISQALARLERGDLTVGAPRAEERLRHIERAVRRLTGAVVFAALLVAGVQLRLAGDHTAATVLLAGAALTGVWVLLR
jgi:predicted unusual protein kinase regulating ubiquinone biosynthesis (AarF/ABC1/UbiB family)